MKRNGSLRDVGFYLLIAVVLLMTIFALRGGMGNQEKVTYACLLYTSDAADEL